MNKYLHLAIWGCLQIGYQSTPALGQNRPTILKKPIPSIDCQGSPYSLDSSTIFKKRFLVPLIGYADSTARTKYPRQSASDAEAIKIDSLEKEMAVNYDFYRSMQTVQEPSTLTSFLTWTRNITGYDKKNFILDGDLQIPIAIGGRRWGLNSIHVIPRFKVRIFRDDPNVPHGIQGDISLPVRTPSYMPGVAYYFSTKHLWNDKNHVKKYFGFYAFHHSNGQDGSELDSASGKINIYNGNFGENIAFEFLVGGRIVNEMLHYTEPMSRRANRAIYLKSPKSLLPIITGSKREYYFRAGYEWHPYQLSNSVFRDLNNYGRFRLNGTFGLMQIFEQQDFMTSDYPAIAELPAGRKFCPLGEKRVFERFRFTANFNYILDAKYARGESTSELRKVGYLEASKRLNVWLSGYLLLGDSKYASAFAQMGYYGSDNYNIYFNESLWHFKIGLAFAFFNQPDRRPSL